MAESSFQFNVISNVISNVIRTALFHGIRHKEGVERYSWVMEITDPIQTYVTVEKNGSPIYSYGNEKYQTDIEALRKNGITEGVDSREGSSTYSMTDGDRYYYLDKEVIRGDTYHLYTIARHPKARSDAAIEKAVRGGEPVYTPVPGGIYCAYQLFPGPVHRGPHPFSFRGTGTGSR